MNIEWVISHLDEFISLTEVVPHPEPHVFEISVRGSKGEIVSQAQVAEKILARVLPKWRTEIASSQYRRWSQDHEAAIRARAEVCRKQEIEDNLGENAPTISADNLHPWVWIGAKPLWQSGHFRSAVEDVAKKVNAETQNKVERRDISETKLFQESFSYNAAEPGKKRLRLMQLDDSNTYKSVQRGARALAEGVFAGIRNPLSHEVDRELTEQEALEYLAALSVLARWVDQSEVESAK